LLVLVVASGLIAAPPPPEPDVKKLVAGLSDPDEKVRNASSAALKGRADALPWLRRAARSTDKATAKQAALLLAPAEKKRQEAVAKAIDACIRDGCIDLLTEWHQYWKPQAEEDLWAVGPRAAKAGMDLYAKSCPKERRDYFERMLTKLAAVPVAAHDATCSEQRFQPFAGLWTIRTDRMDQMVRAPDFIRFASVGGPVRLRELARGGRYLALGSVQTRRIETAFVACDGDVWNEMPQFGPSLGVATGLGIVVCRGNYTASMVGESVLLVDGNIDLTHANRIKGSLIRASGEIALPPDVVPLNCKIEAHAKNPTAPYKFFEVSDVGLSLADDEEGLVVTGVKASTPFGNSGIAKGDLVVAIDDVPAGGSEEFRKKLRRAMVRQGDCLVTVVRGDKTLDLPVFFPLPK
jgi:hypothetical protein